MRKKFYFATLVIAALSFTGCANDEYVGDQRNLGEQNGAIAFSTKSTNTVRANLEGSTAAGKLNDQFWVYGWKTNSSSGTPLVFDNYRVYYTGNTNDLNSPKGWEYVGKQEDAAPAQTIKYWDYSADQYDFEAYSINGDGTVTRNTNSEYIVSDISQNGCANLYFADKKTVSKSSTSEEDKYGAPVKLTFKSVLSKIRVGFYETIPGYSVKITAFYPPSGENPTDFDADHKSTNAFVAWCPNKKIDNNNKSFVVQYETATPAITQVKKGDTYQPISSAPSTGGYTLDKNLTLGGNLFTGEKIGESYSEVTWDNNTSKYTYVIPQNQSALCNPSDGAQAQVQPMKIKVDYTLKSTDGSREEIKVTGATAIVPVEYVQWKPNTAYSYVFKISDQTNGNTGTGTPAGLYPITFDAVVEDYANEGFITTVSTPSVTASQDGVTFVSPDNGIKFEINKQITLKVVNDAGAVISSPTITGGYIEGDTYNYDLTPEKNLTNGGGRIDNNVILTDNKLDEKPRAGYWVLKVAMSNSSSAAFTYVIIRVDSAEAGPAEEGAANS